jgi:hypothetical protein
VDEARIRMPTPPDLDKLELATSVPAPQAPLAGRNAVPRPPPRTIVPFVMLLYFIDFLE